MARQPWALRACGLVAEACLALAAVFALVTCVPEAELRGNLACAALAVAGIGGIAARRSLASPVLRRWGWVAFGVGIACLGAVAIV